MLSEKVWFFCPLTLCIKNGFCPIEIAWKEDCVVCAYSSECPCCAVLNSFQLQASSHPSLPEPQLLICFKGRLFTDFAEQWLNSFSLGRFSWPGMKTELFSSAVLFSSLLFSRCCICLCCFVHISDLGAVLVQLGLKPFREQHPQIKCTRFWCWVLADLVSTCSAVQGCNILYVLWFLEAMRKTVVQPFYSIAASWFCSELCVGHLLEIAAGVGILWSVRWRSGLGVCGGTSSCGRRMEPEEPELTGLELGKGEMFRTRGSQRRERARDGAAGSSLEVLGCAGVLQEEESLSLRTMKAPEQEGLQFMWDIQGSEQFA